MAATLSFDAVYRLLKREPPSPVYYVTGDEDLLKEEVVNWIVEKAVDETSRDFNFDVRNSGDLTGESFFSLVETPPMLAEQRVVVVKSIEQWRSNSKVWNVVKRYLDKPSPTTVLVFTHGAGQKVNKTVAGSSVHVTVDALRPDRLRKWVAMRAERAEVSLTDQAVDHLLNAVGTDLSALAMEIEKLSSVARTDGSAIDASTVADLVGVRRGETSQDWVDAVLLRDIPKAMAMTDAVLAGSGVSGVRLTSALGTGLIGVKLACARVEQGHPASRIRREILAALRSSRPFGLGDWSERASLWTQASAAWSGAEVTRALRLAYECDRRLKSTTLGDERAILAEALLQMVPVEAAA